MLLKYQLPRRKGFYFIIGILNIFLIATFVYFWKLSSSITTINSHNKEDVWKSTSEQNQIFTKPERFVINALLDISRSERALNALKLHEKKNQNLDSVSRKLLSDMIYIRTRVSTCQNSDNGFGLRCGITNQLFEMIQCIFVNLYFSHLVNAQKDDEIEGLGSKVVALLEPNICIYGSWTLCGCSKYVPFSELWNFEKLSQFIGSKEAWQSVTIRSNYSTPEDVFWTNQDKMDIPFPRLDFPWHRVNKDTFLKMMQQRVELDGISVEMMTAVEFEEMDCMRNELIHVSSTRRKLLDILENANTREDMLIQLVKELNKICKRRISEMARHNLLIDDLNQKISRELSVDYSTFHSFEEAGANKFGSYQGIMKPNKDQYLTKVINLGRVYAWYNPVLPQDFQLYSEMYLHLEPRRDLLQKIEDFMKHLKTTAINKKYQVNSQNGRTIVIHVQMPAEHETHIYYTCQRLPMDPVTKTFDWINFLQNDVKVTKGDSILVIGYGFQYELQEIQFPAQKVFKELGAFLFTQTEIFGETTLESIYYNSLYAFFVSMKADVFVSGVCGSQFGNHVLFLRRMQNKKACIASHVDQKTFFSETPIQKHGYNEEVVQRQLNRIKEEVYHYPNFVYGVLFKAPRCKYL
ncbi:hypothetical protein C9374_011285 [Naegleria lovaniensis]|uniref:Uncharacterized protein n=1 Tax=Naegleria lovaniensis TaxID=51637 RepID=A0AA88KWH8_NAELO|nr:uncharacterized protein C9374_011285 [Naegleria lovaniensis]KAG2392560.1 hypothetical protein C9374_011285 [Naegleria lovaniensis]